ncbi:thiamine biosynthesis protein [Desulfobacterota bacterium M19]
MKEKRAIALFSGGLDSILACRLMAEQGIDVRAVTFVSPFFGYELLARQTEHCHKIKEKYGINLTLVEISDAYMAMLRNPAHGYGKHFNPCLDCKIFMMTRAREMMTELKASFIISGEVVGQRPMSQRRDALRVVERESGCEGILLRPLCARRLEPTRPELTGLVDRARLAALSGRSRAGQMAMAVRFGFDDYPTPAGGCILTDPIVSKRIKTYYAEHERLSAADMRLLMVGRQFRLPMGGWLVIGRKESENTVLDGLRQAGDRCLMLKDRPGPTGLLRGLKNPAELVTAAALVARYGKKDLHGRPRPGVVLCQGDEDTVEIDIGERDISETQGLSA